MCLNHKHTFCWPYNANTYRNLTKLWFWQKKHLRRQFITCLLNLVLKWDFLVSLHWNLSIVEPFAFWPPTCFTQWENCGSVQFNKAMNKYVCHVCQALWFYSSSENQIPVISHTKCLDSCTCVHITLCTIDTLLYSTLVPHSKNRETLNTVNYLIANVKSTF